MVKNKNRQAYFVGGGLASLAGAVYLLRDCGMDAGQIHILEGLNILGGSNDGSGDVSQGFLCRGGRMLNEETYENTWELFRSIPSIEYKDTSLCDEILQFDHAHPTHARARLVDKDGVRLNVRSMGFTQKERMRLLKLMLTDEKKLDYKTIEDYFYDLPHFFETNFWFMWQTTFAFQKWSSLFEFRRYMKRMIFEFSRIETLEGVTRTPYNQYDSIILPIKTYLENAGVNFNIGVTVTDIDFKEGDGITAEGIRYTEKGKNGLIRLQEGDICIVTNGCMTDCSSIGSLDKAAALCNEKSPSATLWRKLSEKKPELGNPEPFFGNIEETNWESFTVTLKGNKLLKKIAQFSHNNPGNGALMTFKDSSWLMSVVVAAQPHFKNQPKGTTIFWGYGLYTDKQGDYVKKAMRDCTGKEILTELIYHLHFEEDMEEIMESVINVIPCMMPYVDAQFQPRAMKDRPKVVPKGSTNFAMVSQFVEIADDMVFTEEYSIRGARMAVYKLMGVKKKICPVTPYSKDAKVLMRALKTSYR